MISGSQLAPGRAALKTAQDFNCNGVASIVASQLVCYPMEAALTNAMLAHADETDESHAPSQSHPGCAVIPAALAVAEKFELDGERLLRAIVLCYDIGTRVGITFGRAM
jgi:2-methylcitrate dehydratase PrpD